MNLWHLALFAVLAVIVAALLVWLAIEVAFAWVFLRQARGDFEPTPTPNYEGDE